MKGRIITLGNFDGVHLGHKALFDKTLEISARYSLPSLAITYHPNPAVVLGKKINFSYLQSLEDRKEFILQTGIEQVEILPFTKELSEMEAEDFLEDILINTYQSKHIIIGYNHCFGKNRRGNFQLLEELSGKYNYKVYEVDPVFSGDEKISSSVIRKYLAEGNLEKANACLGRNFSILGEVEHGRKMGRELGSPTANLSIPTNQVIPSHGVYATITNGKFSVTNIGHKPTFDDVTVSIETHILDWNGDLYDTNIRIEFIKKLRNITKFLNQGELRDQIQKDIEEARKTLAKLPISQ
ncbi:MAG: bifunctional riboflavin kinase/FAD synthetase [Leptospira sp.]|nr:bifunctional riboflavin kinase/FAD synthetase [Leptospira sp.]